MVRHVMVVADSLAFHGAERAEPWSEPRLWPNRLAVLLTERLGEQVSVDVTARLGWTARDAWWAFTRDPQVWSVHLRRADLVLLAVGSMDHLPSGVPTWVRDGIQHLPSAALRRRAARAHHLAHPWLVRAHRGHLRTLGQRQSEAYLTRCVEGVRYFRPGVPVVGITPPEHDSTFHAHVTRGHAGAVAGYRAWGLAHDVPQVHLAPVVAPFKGQINVDGMHWSFPVHEAAAQAYADVLEPLLRTAPRPAP